MTIAGVFVEKRLEGIENALTAITSKPSPSPLPKVLYQADWSNGLDGWSGLDGRPGSPDWKAEGGMLISDGTFQDAASPTITPPYRVDNTADYAVEVKIQELGGQGCFDTTVIRGQTTPEGLQGYRLAIGCMGEGVAIITTQGNSLSKIAYANFPSDQNWHVYRLEAQGNMIRAFIDSIQVLAVKDYTHLTGGITGIKSLATPIKISIFKIISL